VCVSTDGVWDCTDWPARDLPTKNAWVDPCHAGYLGKYVWPDEGEHDIYWRHIEDACGNVPKEGKILVQKDAAAFLKACTDEVRRKGAWWTWGEIILGAVSLATAIVALPAVGCSLGVCACASGVSITSGAASTSMTVGWAHFCGSAESCCEEINACMIEKGEAQWDEWDRMCQADGHARFASTAGSRCEAQIDSRLAHDAMQRRHDELYECTNLCKH
jgi:hypothetical protein